MRLQTQNLFVSQWDEWCAQCWLFAAYREGGVAGEGGLLFWSWGVGCGHDDVSVVFSHDFGADGAAAWTGARTFAVQQAPQRALESYRKVFCGTALSLVEDFRVHGGVYWRGARKC